MNDTTSSKTCSDSDALVLKAKKLVWDFHDELEKCSADDSIKTVLDKYAQNGTQYVFRCCYPFRELQSTAVVSSRFWQPLKSSFSGLQRRPDIFIAGKNSVHSPSEEDDQGVWVLSMGHFMGLFDKDWIGIRYNRQMTMIRYAEFTHVIDDKVVQTGLFLDIIGLMQSVGMNPLPPSTGTHFVYPGPRTHDGLDFRNRNAPPEEGKKTQDLVDRMCEDLSKINHSFSCDPAILRKTWKEDMIWYGPAGIGASYTIARYQEQHQLPFRSRLSDKKFMGHQVRVAEGNYAAFFGWPMNLTNSPMGGFLGLPGGNCKDCPMQVVDVYRRDGDKLAENWVLIDMLWYLKHQGLDVLQRTTGIMNPASLHYMPPTDDTSKRSFAEESMAEEPLKKKIKDISMGGSVVSDEGEKHSHDYDDYASNEIDMSKITHGATIDMSDILKLKSDGIDRSREIVQKRNMPMPGFEETFVDIVDYILRITYWIWHEKKVDLCRDYYSDDCPMHTMAGDLYGVDTVIANTWSTLDAFPDRHLDGENVVWSREFDLEGPGNNTYRDDGSASSAVYYSSHLIVSRMTNKGNSDWGPATNILARIRTVADCVCSENKIVHEWLMRDNALLVKTLGYDVNEIAAKQAKQDLDAGKNLLDFLAPERKRVKENRISTNIPNCNDDIERIKSPVTIVVGPEVHAFAQKLFATLWQDQIYDKVPIFYDYRVSAHLNAGRELWGTDEMMDYLREFQSGLSNIATSIDHVACIPYLGENTFDVAVRWTLTANHTGDSKVLGEASNAPIYILASSHLRIIRNRVREEWTVFDELALQRQVETQRLINAKSN